LTTQNRKIQTQKDNKKDFQTK